MDWPFGALPENAYGLILADPPWKFLTRSARGEGKSACRHYPTMTRAELYALPVWRLAAPNAALCMWFTSTSLPLALDLMKHWGFDYKSLGFWAKRSRSWTPAEPDPKWAFGTGYWAADCAEGYLWGARGRPLIHRGSERNLIEAARREHSEKPEEIYGKCERMFPATRKLDLFSRQTRPGWDAWGDEAGKFDERAAPC